MNITNTMFTPYQIIEKTFSRAIYKVSSELEVNKKVIEIVKDESYKLTGKQILEGR